MAFNGCVTAPELPGTGAEIKPEIFRNSDAVLEIMARI
jgi:hypothetical protein